MEHVFQKIQQVVSVDECRCRCVSQLKMIIKYLLAEKIVKIYSMIDYKFIYYCRFYSSHQKGGLEMDDEQIMPKKVPSIIISWRFFFN